MLMLRVLDVLNLDGYRSLWDKFRDEGRELYRPERYWVNENYKAVFGDMFRHMQFKKCLEMRQAKSKGEYLTLYYMMQRYLEEIEEEEC